MELHLIGRAVGYVTSLLPARGSHVTPPPPPERLPITVETHFPYRTEGPVEDSRALAVRPDTAPQDMMEEGSMPEPQTKEYVLR